MILTLTPTTATVPTTTPTTSTTPVRPRAAVSPDQVDAATRGLLAALTEAGPEHPGWRAAGPLVAAAARCLRIALGSEVHDPGADLPPIVQEADLALAARPLLRADTRVVEQGAAATYLRVAAAATVALS